MVLIIYKGHASFSLFADLTNPKRREINEKKEENEKKEQWIKNLIIPLNA